MTEQKRVLISEATKEQLRAFVDIYGLEIDGRAGKDALAQALEAAGYVADTIPLISQPRPTERTYNRSSRQVVWNKVGRPCFAILIPAREGKNRDQGQEIAHNGNLIVVPRGKPVPVPITHVINLEIGVQTIYDTDENGVITGSRQVPSVPFQHVDISDLNPADVASDDFEPSEAQKAEAQHLVEAWSHSRKIAA